MAPWRKPRVTRLNGGKATFGAVDLDVTSWSLSLKNRLCETTSSASSGLATWQAGVSEGDGTFECLWDSTAIPDTDTGLTRGASGTLKLYAGDSGKFYSATVLVESLNVKVNNLGGDVVKADVGFKISGTLTLPLT